MYDFESGIFMDEASIQMSTDGGSSWSTIWEYDWLSGDAQPWTEDNFSLTPSNNVKIRFLIDGYEFFQDYTDWYIDDFKIYTPTDNEPPYFTNTTIWPDTNLTGPFPVYSMITDASGIDSAYLNYRVNSGSWQQLVMNPQGDDMYAATIPQQNMDDTIDYYLWARDLWIEPNTGADPVGAPGEAYYSFTIGIIGVLEDDLSLISFLPLMSNPTKGKVKVKFTVPKKMNVSLVVYDVAGRKVRQLIQGQVQGGEHQVVWNRKDDQRREIAAGIYFLSFSVDESAGFNKIEKFILLK